MLSLHKFRYGNSGHKRDRTWKVALSRVTETSLLSYMLLVEAHTLTLNMPQAATEVNVHDEAAARAKAIELFNADLPPGLPLAVIRNEPLPAQPKKRTSQQQAAKQPPAKQPRLPSSSSAAAETQFPASQLYAQPAQPAGHDESSFNLPPRLLKGAAWVRGCVSEPACAASGWHPLLTHEHCTGMTRSATLTAPSATWSALARCAEQHTAVRRSVLQGLRMPLHVSAGQLWSRPAGRPRLPGQCI